MDSKNKQQTAVDWLWEKLLEETETGQLRYHLKHDVLKVFKEALQMEREQIEQAYRIGVEEDVYNNPLRTGTDYFNDIYGTSKSR